MWSTPERVRRVVEKIGDEKPIIITKGSNIRYFTGIPYPEGSVFIAIPNENRYLIITNVLEFYRFEDYAPKWLEVYSFYRSRKEMIVSDDIKILAEDPASSIKKLLEKYSGNIYCELEGLPCKLAEKIRELCKEDISKTISLIRSIKSVEEINYIRKAISIAENAFTRVYDELSNNDTELSIAGKIKYYMNLLGGEREAFPTIVAFDHNAAYPHAVPTNLSLANRKLVLIDWGTVFEGYNSDMTRTFLWNKDERISDVIEKVKEALEAAVDKVQPGIMAKEIDFAARKILSKHGLGNKFIHGLGHGVGIDVHEEPYIRPGSTDIIEEGMVFTIEPGVYVHGDIGVRIEEMVLVTQKGARVLTSLPRIFE